MRRDRRQLARTGDRRGRSMTPRLRRLLVAGSLALALLAGVSVTAQSLWSQPHFLNMSNGIYVYRMEPGLNDIPFTGQAWGLFFPPTGFTDAIIRKEISGWLSPNPNRVYFVSMNPMAPYNYPAPPEWDAFRMRSFDGEYIDHAGGAFPQYSLSSRTFQEFLKAQARFAVDVGATGAHTDDIQGPLSVMLYTSPDRAGSFDGVTIAAFRAWLGQHYSAEELRSQFQVTDLSTLDFADYIRTHGLSGTWNKAPVSGLPLAYFRFRRAETLDFLRDLIQSTKQYARDTYHRDFLFSSNAAFDPMAFYARDVMDLSTNEAFYIRGTNPAHPFLATDIKAWTGWKSPTVAVIEPFPHAVGAANPLSTPTTNLMRAIIADVQAAGGIPCTSLQLNENLGGAVPMDLPAVARYAKFILANAPLMSQTSSPARIALIESAPSLLGGYVATPAEPNPWPARAEYTGTARLLLENGYAYDSIFFPDASYSTLPSGTQDLGRYDLVIAPHAWSLSDEQVAGLLQYVDAGGKLLVIGSFGKAQPDGSKGASTRMPAFPASGTVAIGKGRVVISPTTFGSRYQDAGAVHDDGAAQRSVSKSFLDWLAPYAQRDVQVTGVTALVHEPGITPFLYLDRAGQPLLHLVNYDYDDATDQFVVKNAFRVVVRVGAATPVGKVVLSSPDLAQTQTLTFSRSGDLVTVEVPSVDAWAILSFQP